jgi:hypothetical protein
LDQGPIGSASRLQNADAANLGFDVPANGKFTALTRPRRARAANAWIERMFDSPRRLQERGRQSQLAQVVKVESSRNKAAGIGRKSTRQRSGPSLD